MKPINKRIIVSREKEKKKTALEKAKETEELKYFLVEEVSEDCDDLIKKLKGQEVLLTGEGVKLATDSNKEYYLVEQARVICSK